MDTNGLHRKLVVRSLLSERRDSLLDIGCGPISSSYFYAQQADHITCIDWKLHRIEPIPPNIECIEGDFTKIQLPLHYDSIVAADVFEHIALDEEPQFVQKCVSALKPFGHLIVSVPHRGTFAWLDPYGIKPKIHWLLWRAGLYHKIHNGHCDIRKGHKHYLLEELVEAFRPLEFKQAVYWGYFFDPVLSWTNALSRDRLNLDWLENCFEREFEHEWGSRAFNIAVCFQKSNI
jgi:SAM-dependent methyltransferase